jgi:hypothetical protein
MRNSVTVTTVYYSRGRLAADVPVRVRFASHSRFLMPPISEQLQELIARGAALPEVLDDDSCQRAYRNGVQEIVSQYFAVLTPALLLTRKNYSNLRWISMIFHIRGRPL